MHDIASELDDQADRIAALAKKSADFSAGLALAVGQLRIRAREIREQESDKPL